MTTIKDVAKIAGVSVATVSRVLNSSGYVSEEAFKKVSAAIKYLNYQPNSVARALYHKQSKMIGLIVPDIQNPFFPELARAVEDVANIYGYTVILCNSDQDVDKERHYLDVLKQKYVDGVIMTTLEREINAYIETSPPIIALDRISDERLPTVVSDNYEGAWQATEALTRKGAKCLAHIRGPRGVTSSDERYRGFMDYVKKYRLSYVIKECSFQLDNAEKLAERFYREHPEVDGVFASNDVVAAGFLKVALKQGISIPEALQIIGFDGVSSSRMCYPELTTIAQPIYKMGALAARLCIKLIEGQNTSPVFRQLAVKMIEGGTTKL